MLPLRPNSVRRATPAGPDHEQRSLEMLVVKRDGKKEPVAFDKITARIKKLCYGFNPEHVDPVEKAKRAGLEELERAKEAGEKAEEDDLAWEKLNLMNASATQAQKDLSSPPPAAPVALPGSIGDTDASGDRPADEARKEEEPTHEAAACGTKDTIA